MFEAMADKNGYASHTVMTGKDGIAAFAAGPYDVVVTDLQLPDMKGTEVVCELRKNDNDVPIVIVTGSGSEKIAAEALSHGVSNYVIKDGQRSFSRQLPSIIQSLISQRQATRARQGAEARYRTLAMVAPVGIFHTNPEGQVTFVNDRWCEIAGMSPDDALGKGWHAALHPDDRAEVAAAWQGFVRSAGLFEKEYRYRRPNGEFSYCLVRAMAETDGNGDVTGYVGAVTDISEQNIAEAELKSAHDLLEQRVAERTRELKDEIAVREAAEKELAGKERLLRNALDNMSGGLFMFGPDFNIEIISPSFSTFYEIPPALCVEGTSAIPIIRFRAERGDYGPGDTDQIVARRLAGYDMTAPQTVIDAVSGNRTIELFRAPLEDGRVIGVFNDVTERLNSEKARKESEHRYSTVVDHIGDSIVVHDFDGNIVEVNSSASENLEYARDELLAMTIGDIEIAVPVDKILETWRNTDPGQRRAFKGMHRRKDGTVFPVDVRGEIIEISGQQRILVSARDMTEAQAAEAARAEAEGQLRAIVDASPSAISLAGIDGGILTVNKTYSEWAAADPSALIGKSPADLYVPETAAEIEQCNRQVLGTGETFIAERTLLFPDGVRRQVLTHKCPIASPAGEIYALATINTDITEQRRTEAHLLHAEKLATLGRMAAGITHELAQPLNIIRLVTQSSLLERNVSDDTTEALETIDSQIVRMAEIIDHMRIFARKDTAPHQIFPPLASVEAALGFMAQQFAAMGITVNKHVGAITGNISGAAVQLEQVLLNILSNAGDAVTSRGTDATDPDAPEAKLIEVSAFEDVAENSVTITISDNGGGIAEDVRAHIFEPFFTTKEVGSGTGLGLSVCSTIIEAMNGEISIENTAEGACFTITLPRLEPAAEPEIVDVPAANRGASPGRVVLVVEDEGAAASLVVKHLRRAGFETLNAANGAEALNIYQSQTVHAVITDLQMPTMDGETLIAHLRADSSTLPIIITTGKLPVGDDDGIIAEGATHVFKKPVDLKEIVATLERVF